MGAAYHPSRTLTTLEDGGHRTRHIRRCLPRACPQFHRPYRPEAEGRLALPQHACGRDVMAYAGPLRYAQHRRLPAIHPPLRSRGGAIALRTSMPLLARYDDLLTLSRTDTARLQRMPQAQGRGRLALDGLQPDVGPAGLWVLRDGLAGDGLLARRVVSVPPPALAVRLRTVRHNGQVPRVSSVSDGPLSLRGAVAEGGADGATPTVALPVSPRGSAAD
jgi:hypothetical protein